ncbi:MAG: hypothetical protein IKL91_01335 [Bacteroidales bacterium]|nr:hypothetical protein [Bacteroidales bacterium]
MDYGKNVRNISRCLECGDEIKYGRTDKKFCCEDCRMSYNNALQKSSRGYKRRVLSVLSRNYAILDGLLKSGRETSDLQDLELHGFQPGMVTSYRRCGKHDVFCCFDIKYIMTATKIYSVMKIKNFK